MKERIDDGFFLDQKEVFPGKSIGAVKGGTFPSSMLFCRVNFLTNPEGSSLTVLSVQNISMDIRNEN